MRIPLRGTGQNLASLIGLVTSLLCHASHLESNQVYVDLSNEGSIFVHKALIVYT
jgi:hypothetical protein